MTDCNCGDPGATSLDPAEAVVHSSSGPCYIVPLEPWERAVVEGVTAYDEEPS